MFAVVGRLSRGGLLIALLVAGLFGSGSSRAQSTAPDPLPSWNDGLTMKSITDFVARATTQGGTDFVSSAERIATFDNDGTLWSEQPMYFQMAFALDRVKTLAPQHPQWKSTQPFKAVLEGDLKALMAAGEKGAVELTMAIHAGMTTDEFEGIVKAWLASARHPRFQRPYTDLVFQPMIELLAYLRANGFKTYIVSGGGTEFMRPWTENVCGIPPEQVVGLSIVEQYQLKDDKPRIMRLPSIDFIDDGPGKPVGIHKFIGRRPVFAAGNSDGDLQMPQWTTLTAGARFGLIVHHTDAEREYAYDRQSAFGRLDKAPDEAPKRGWLTVDVKRDWKVIYPFQK